MEINTRHCKVKEEKIRKESQLSQSMLVVSVNVREGESREMQRRLPR